MGRASITVLVTGKRPLLPRAGLSPNGKSQKVTIHRIRICANCGHANHGISLRSARRMLPGAAIYSLSPWWQQAKLTQKNRHRQTLDNNGKNNDWFNGIPCFLKRMLDAHNDLPLVSKSLRGNSIDAGRLFHEVCPPLKHAAAVR